MRIRTVTARDREAVVAMLRGSWGSPVVVSHTGSHDAACLPGILAERDGTLAGLLTYQITDAGLEIVTLDAVPRHAGVGTALLAEATGIARAAGVSRIWLTTTNDNLDALRFDQRRGLRIVGVTPGAVDSARTVKPEIPLIGQYGIPLHDELTLERGL